MNNLGLPENKYGNVACWDAKAGITIPDGYITTPLSGNQLNLIKVPYAKAHIGFDFAYRRHVPILVNIIRIEDEEKAFKHQQKLYIKANYRIPDADFLFK